MSQPCRGISYANATWSACAAWLARVCEDDPVWNQNKPKFNFQAGTFRKLSAIWILRHVVFRYSTRNGVNGAVAVSRIRGQQLECEGKEADHPLKLLYLNSVHFESCAWAEISATSILSSFSVCPRLRRQFNPDRPCCSVEVLTLGFHRHVAMQVLQGASFS